MVLPPDPLLPPEAPESSNKSDRRLRSYFASSDKAKVQMVHAFAIEMIKDALAKKKPTAQTYGFGNSGRDRATNGRGLPTPLARVSGNNSQPSPPSQPNATSRST